MTKKMEQDKLIVMKPRGDYPEVTREEFMEFVEGDPFFRKVHEDVLRKLNEKFSHHTAFSRKPGDYQFIKYDKKKGYAKNGLECAYVFTRLMHSGGFVDNVFYSFPGSKEGYEAIMQERIRKSKEQVRLRFPRTLEGRTESEEETDILVGTCFVKDKSEYSPRAFITCTNHLGSWDPYPIDIMSFGFKDSLRIQPDLRSKSRRGGVSAEVVFDDAVPDSIEEYIPRSILLEIYPRALKAFKISKGIVYPMTSRGNSKLVLHKGKIDRETNLLGLKI